MKRVKIARVEILSGLPLISSSRLPVVVSVD